ncbi:MAG: MgtC/SapB family protein [Clostridium sp.]|nr:MgtC/SapB family protein [Clostridium sp.]
MEDFFLDSFVIEKSMLLDILLAIILGFAIGFEREITNKWAGLRTHMLVCLGSCIFTLLSIHAFPVYAHSPQADPARIAAQILTGIGFIGGGTVLRHGYSIYGLTTAATLWITASIGMACGCGFTAMAIICTVLAVGTLVLIRMFEKQYLHRGAKAPRKFKVSFFADIDVADKVYSSVIEKFNSIFEIKKSVSSSSDDLTKISFKLDLLDKNPIQSVHNKLNSIEGIESVSIQELYD